MAGDYNPTYYHDGKLWYRREPSISVFDLPDGTLIGIFQGAYGDRPDLDFVVRFLLPGGSKRLRTPKNVHWVVDILMIGKNQPDEALKLTRALLRCYEASEAFDTVAERKRFQPKRARRVASNFAHLDKEGAISVAFVTHVVELFSICEKASPRDTKMFQSLLLKLQDYFAGRSDYYQVLSATSAGFR